MQENELKEYQRLRAEGRWAQASEFREAERKRLRAAGRNRQQARDESWTAMVAKHPAVSKVESPLLGVEAERIEEIDEGVFIEHTEDEQRELVELTQDPGAWDDSWSEALSWASAYRELEVTPSRAPSVLAWLLRKLCREDFYRFSVLVFTDYCLRHGHQLRFQPTATEREERLRQQMLEDLEVDEIMARLDEEDRRLGKSPTLMEALDKAETEAESKRLISQAVQRWAAEQGLNQRSSASTASKS